MNWEKTPTDKIFELFGYNFKDSFKNDEEKAEKRATAIKRMESYGKIPKEVMDDVYSVNDTQLAREKRERERKEAERRRREEIRRTKARNRAQDIYEDDDEARAVYEHLLSENEIDEDEIIEAKERVEMLQKTLNKNKSNLEKIESIVKSVSTETTKYDELIQNLELDIEALESEIEETIDEIEENDIYSTLYESQYTHYGLRNFETPYGEFAVGDDEDADTAAKQSIEDLFYDLGMEAYSNWVIENNLDEERLKKDISDSYIEYFEEEIREYLSDYFDDYDEDDEDTHPSDEDIEEKAEDMANDRAEDLVSNPEELSALGYDIKDYVDVDGLANDVIGADGRGHILSSYDGNEHEIDINDTWYYIYRTN